MTWIVYTEILNGTPNPERWFYGEYSDRNRANEVALDLGADHPVYHCVCKASEARELNIQNLPANL